jgi:proline dehydrogenase
LIFITVQNYLRKASNVVNYEIKKNKYLETNFAVKMVRGAYMVEESELALLNGY